MPRLQTMVATMTCGGAELSTITSCAVGAPLYTPISIATGCLEDLHRLHIQYWGIRIPKPSTPDDDQAPGNNNEYPDNKDPPNRENDCSDLPGEHPGNKHHPSPKYSSEHLPLPTTGEACNYDNRPSEHPANEHQPGPKNSSEHPRQAWPATTTYMTRRFTSLQYRFLPAVNRIRIRS